MHGDVP